MGAHGNLRKLRNLKTISQVCKVSVYSKFSRWPCLDETIYFEEDEHLSCDREPDTSRYHLGYVCTLTQNSELSEMNMALEVNKTYSGK